MSIVFTDDECAGLPVRGPIPTIYDGNRGPVVGFNTALPVLKRARPEAIQLHSWEIERGAKAVRGVFPNMPILAGFGIDGIARKVSAKQITPEQAADEFVKLADLAVRAGCIAVVWNAEGYYKAAKDSTVAALLAKAVRLGLLAVAAKYPHLVQLHTSYDHPSYHSTYPWKAFLGAGSPVRGSFPQVYAAPEGELRAARGSLPSREARALSSWDAAVRAGWIRDDGGEELSDCDWLPYYQAHHGDPLDMVRGFLRHPLCFVWAFPTRADAQGTEAFLSACAIHRTGVPAGSMEGREVAAWQGIARAGEPALDADNAPGPMTREASLRALDRLNGELDARAKATP